MVQLNANTEMLDKLICKNVKRPICVFSGEDTMTGDGGEYLRAEDLRELGDDSLDSFGSWNHNSDR